MLFNQCLRSDLHLSESILSVVTAAVSPVRWFLYIFSPCRLLLNLVLMRLSTAHSTACSDLDIVNCCLETGDWRVVYPALQTSLQTFRQHLGHCLMAPGWTSFRQLTH